MAFLLPNIMFFGLSSLKMYQNHDDNQIFIMNTDNTSDPLYSPLINQNQMEIMVEQLYIWEDTCVGNASYMVPSSGYTCTVGCLLTEYNNSNQYCLSCGHSGYNCYTCDDVQCLVCDNNAPTYRVLDTVNSPNTCICLTGYFELSNGSCTLCSDYISYCLVCSNQSACTSCSGGFVP